MGDLGGKQNSRYDSMSKLRERQGTPVVFSRARVFFARSPWKLCAVLVFGIVSVCFAHFASAQISPGPLARAHQSLSGGENCIKCHEVNTKAPTFRCLDCHKEIAAEFQSNKGLHATFPRSGPAGSACVKCHSDHNGADFQMIHWNPTSEGFDHTKTGFTLDGKHVGVNCRECH